MGGSQAVLPGQLMPVPPGPRALQHVQVSSSTKRKASRGTVFFSCKWRHTVCEPIVRGGSEKGEKEKVWEEKKGRKGDELLRRRV